MSLHSLALGSVVTIHIIILFIAATKCFPIKNGFSVKFNPISSKEDMKLKSFGAIFAKVPQELNLPVADEVSNAIFPQAAGLSVGSSNQIMKILFPLKATYRNNDSKLWNDISFINIPMIRQPVSDYKVIVAAAPRTIRIGRGEEAKPVVVYIVFPDDDSNDSRSLNMPVIYFVNKHVNNNVPLVKSDKGDPILIIDSNRTVTGLKSNAVAKFLTFKNKLITRNHIDLIPKIKIS